MNTSERTIGEIVAADYRTAKVFENHGIDFCCGGDDCPRGNLRGKGSRPCRDNEGTRGREAWTGRAEPEFRLVGVCRFWPTTSSMPTTPISKRDTGQIAAYAHKIAGVHGAHHPEVIEIATIFDKVAVDMAAHLREEEEVFFPAIKRAHATRKARLSTGCERHRNDQDLAQEAQS